MTTTTTLPHFTSVTVNGKEETVLCDIITSRKPRQPKAEKKTVEGKAS